MFDCICNVIVVGHVQLYHINGGADAAATELLDRLLSLLDIPRT
jgi:hypothetical protein